MLNFTKKEKEEEEEEFRTGRLCPIDSLVSHVCCVKLTCTRTRVFRLFPPFVFLPLFEEGKGEREREAKVEPMLCPGMEEEDWRSGFVVTDVDAVVIIGAMGKD